MNSTVFELWIPLDSRFFHQELIKLLLYMSQDIVKAEVGKPYGSEVKRSSFGYCEVLSTASPYPGVSTTVNMIFKPSSSSSEICQS